LCRRGVLRTADNLAARTAALFGDIERQGPVTPATIDRITALRQRYLRGPVPILPFLAAPTFIDIEHLSELSAICASSRDKDIFWK
jgi:hypothetical protein